MIGGKTIVRKDALSKALGRERFVADVSMPGMLHAATVRAPAVRARIIGIDLSAVAASDGVEAVVSASNVPAKNRVPLIKNDYPFLAEDEIRFHGQPVAIVAARTHAAAKAAAEKASFRLDEIPAILSIDDSLSGFAPPLHGKDNVFSKNRIRKGDADKALKKAAHRFSGVFETGHQLHAYLEPQGMIAAPEPSGGIMVTGSMQCPFYVRDAVCAATGLHASRVRVVQAATGGAFGGKEDVPSIIAGHAAMLALATGRPVKLIYDRDEDCATMSRRHPARVSVDIGCDATGRIMAARISVLLDGGAYVTLSPIVLWRAAVHAAGPYDIPNVSVDAAAMATNTAPAGAFRGFGQPQVSFAIESAIDALAAKAGIDPVELRIANALRTGSRTATGQRLSESVGLSAALEKAGGKRDEFRAGKRRKRVLHGVGVSCSHYGVGLGAAGRKLARAGAFVQVMADGSVSVAVGNTEMGQGARTALSLIAAEALNAPIDLVDLLETDTTRVQDSGPTVASRTTMVSGNAILDACAPIRRVVDAAAAGLLGCKTTDLVAQSGIFWRKGGRKRLRFEDAVALCHEHRTHMACQGFFRTEGVSFDPKTGLGDAYPTYTYSAHTAEVEIDPRTGETRVTRVESFHDIGTVINPLEAQGQCSGGIAQGAGLATIEHLALSGGRMSAPGFAGYLVPTSVDAPETGAVFVEGYNPVGPFGARGLGEPSLLAVPAAIANAISDAIGKRVTKLPATPERILELLKATGAPSEARQDPEIGKPLAVRDRSRDEAHGKPFRQNHGPLPRG